jgi:hypothetical protein
LVQILCKKNNHRALPKNRITFADSTYHLYMAMKKNFAILTICLAVWGGCTKEPGLGGTCTLIGRVRAEERNNAGTLLRSYWLADERVYLIYGENPVYDDDMRTHYDGTYRFGDLRPGHYTVFCYSDCDTCASGTQPVFAEAQLDHHGQVDTLPVLVVQR